MRQDYFDNNQVATQLQSTIKDYINFGRTYIARWCPLNMTLVSEFIEEEVLTVDEEETFIPNVIFTLNPSSYALITLDLRHIED